MRLVLLSFVGVFVGVFVAMALWILSAGCRLAPWQWKPVVARTHLGRVLGAAAAGHTIRLMSPEYVRPYVKANKNDDHDAEAIAEAATRPTMRFVPVKSEDAIGHPGLASGALATGGRAHRTDQPSARAVAGARHRRGTGPAQAGGCAFRSPPTRTIPVCRRGCGFWSRICAPNGAASMNGSPPSTRSSCIWRARMKRRAGFQRYLGSASSTRPRLLLRSATRGASGAARGPCRLVGVVAPTGDNRRQAATARNIQARQPLSASEPDPWCTRGAAAHHGSRYAARPVGPRSVGSGAQEHCRRGAGSQAGAHRLGSATQGTRLRSGDCGSIGIEAV